MLVHQPRSRPFRTFLLVVVLLLLLVAGQAARAGGPRHYPLPTPETPVALLQAGRTNYVVTSSGVFRRAARRLVRLHTSPAPVRCALACADTALWLGTSQGVVRLSLRTGQAYAEPLPAPATGQPISTLFAGPGGSLWAGVPSYGAYERLAGHWVLRLGSPTINAGLSTTDSSVWVATNTGLYRWQHQDWVRYNEEGVANHEIPDNLVDNLLPDNAGNLWVLMSEGLSVFEGVNRPAGGPPAAAAADELPTVRYLGQPGNPVYGLLRLPGQGHVFATGLGLLLLPPATSGAALASLDTHAPDDRIEAPRRLLPLRLPQAPATPVLLQADARRRVWLAGPAGTTVWTAAAFRRAVARAAATPAG